MGRVRDYLLGEGGDQAIESKTTSQLVLCLGRTDKSEKKKKLVFTHIRNKMAPERDEATLPLDRRDGVVTPKVCISDVWLVAPDVAQEPVRHLRISYRTITTGTIDTALLFVRSGSTLRL